MDQQEALALLRLIAQLAVVVQNPPPEAKAAPEMNGQAVDFERVAQ